VEGYPNGEVFRGKVKVEIPEKVRNLFYEFSCYLLEINKVSIILKLS
jgi:hypothetical protein